MGERIVVALGGNALEKKESNHTASEQLEVVRETVKKIADLVEEGYEIAIVHGNGPQVGNILLQSETAKNVVPSFPLDVCNAMSQGYIGYHIAQALGDELKKREINKPVICVTTQVVVDPLDRAFKDPTKPIGPYYTKDEAKKLQKEKGYKLKEQEEGMYRRVVASPNPKEIVEIESIKELLKTSIVISCGGGGIPVVKDEKGRLRGIECVIDKDYSAELLAEEIDAKCLLILTNVENVCLNFGTPKQTPLRRMTYSEAERHFIHGEFKVGSMFPKVAASMKFVNNNGERRAIISSLDKATEAIHVKTGTIIVYQ